MTRVLVVDDDSHILRALRINLRAGHYGVETPAAVPRRALTIFSVHPVDGLGGDRSRGRVSSPRNECRAPALLDVLLTASQRL